MSIVTRCGSIALLLGVVAGAPALAQTAPDTAGSWTDPPPRNAAGPPAGTNAVEAVKTARKADEPAKKARRAAEPAQVARKGEEPRRTARKAEEPSKTARKVEEPVRTVRREEPARTARRTEAASRPVEPSAAAPRQRVETRRVVAVRRDPVPVRRQTVRRVPAAVATAVPAVRRRAPATFPPRSYGYAYAGSFEPPIDHPRRADWNGPAGDDRAERIARARAAGYRVMRLRTYSLPGGGETSDLLPFDDLD